MDGAKQYQLEYFSGYTKKDLGVIFKCWIEEKRVGFSTSHFSPSILWKALFVMRSIIIPEE